MAFCVAGVALRDILTCLKKCQRSFCVTRAILLQGFQKDLHFSWPAQHFGDLHGHFAWEAQHFRRVVLRAFLRMVLSGLRQVVSTCQLRGRRGRSWERHLASRTQHLVKIRRVWTVVLCARRGIWATLLYTLHPTLHTWHSALYTLHSSLHTLLHTP